MKEEERVIITICDDEGNLGEFEIVDCHENEKGIYGDIADRCVDLVESIGLPKCQLCTHCFDGSSKFTLEEVNLKK